MDGWMLNTLSKSTAAGCIGQSYTLLAPSTSILEEKRVFSQRAPTLSLPGGREAQRLGTTHGQMHASASAHVTWGFQLSTLDSLGRGQSCP